MGAISGVPTTRVTDQFIRQRLMQQVQYSQRELYRLQVQMSTGYQYEFPSEKPIASLRVISLQRLLEQKAQVKTNLATSQSFLDASDAALSRVSQIVAEARGTALGIVLVPPHAVDQRIARGLPRVHKRADHRELAREEANRRRAADAQRICLHRIRERGLPMKLIRTEASYDGSKMVFFFFAEERVDFRDLVRDLAQTLHMRIEMKQIGHRDETRMIGGVGPCGRELVRGFDQTLVVRSIQPADQGAPSLSACHGETPFAAAILVLRPSVLRDVQLFDLALDHVDNAFADVGYAVGDALQVMGDRSKGLCQGWRNPL